MLLPPIVLIAVVAIAFVGRVSGPGPSPRVDAAAVVVAEARAEPSVPAATPTFRSDWPAAISGGIAPTPVPLPREEGTDGLMGRLPFGLPNDTPTIRVEPIAWWRVYDERAEWSRGWSPPDTTPPSIRRLHGLSSYVTDPYMR